MPETPTVTTQKRLSLKAWGLMLFLALVWGGSFTANHAALAHVPVATTVALRVMTGALALWAYIWAAGLPLPQRKGFWRDALVLGLGNNVVPFSLIVWGQTHVPSGLAGILNASTALFSVLVAAMVFADERLTLPRLIGVLTGMAGVAVIVGPGALAHLDLTSLGQLAILGAGLSYALCAAFARRALKGVRPEVGAASMLTAASLMMLPAALLIDGVPGLPPAPSIAAILYLGLLSSALAYRLYYSILDLAGMGNLSLVTLLIAPVAVLLGWLIFGETLPPEAFAGMALLTLGMVILDGRAFARIKAQFSA